MAIKLDSTRHSVVIICTACPWRGVAANRGDAWPIAAPHEQHAHDGQGNARNASYKAAQRSGGTG